MRTIKTILMVVVMGLAATAGFAQVSTTDTDNITATVMGNCWIGAFSLGFGNYDPFAAADHDVSTQIVVRCTKDVDAEVTLSLGNNHDGASRNMSSDTTNDSLAYELYTDSAGGTVWGNDPLSGVSVTGLGPVADINLSVHGRVFKEQAAGAANDYVDTVVATINW